MGAWHTHSTMAPYGAGPTPCTLIEFVNLVPSA